MKKMFLLALLALASASACKHEPVINLVEAQITGQDYRKCMCCGGWWLQTADGTYLFSSYPTDAGLDLNNAEAYPISVKVAFEPDSSICNGLFNRIKITTLQLP
jgi:hypothetical protein